MSREQYFSHYAEPEIHQLDDFPLRHYDQVIGIPAFDETPAFLQHLQSATQAYTGKVLLILVINQPETVEACSNNEYLVSYLRQLPCLWQNSQGMSLVAYEHLDILSIDRFSEGKRIPVKQGVGLARKIACDIAAWLIHHKHITTHQIFCSDADVIFPDNYFFTELPKNNSAAVLDFQHIASNNDDINKATWLYEKSLYHYVSGLQQAGSDYAFHTIGSCLLLHADFYTKARGFPIRPAGEDFYLLNKLQKLAPVTNLHQTVLQIESRLSHRVPFGTGPAVGKLLNSEEAAIFYHPQCFNILGEWLKYLDLLAMTGHYVNPQHTDANIQKYLLELTTLFNTEETVMKLFANHKGASARKNHLHQWFDGFKTLKTIHYLRDRHFPSITYTSLQTFSDHNNDHQNAHADSQN